MLGNRNKLHRVESYIDTEVLRWGFNFLGQFEGLRSADAPALRAFFQTLMDLEMAVLPDSPDTDSDEFQNQYPFDDWLMTLASIYFATLPTKGGVRHGRIADFVPWGGGARVDRRLPEGIFPPGTKPLPHIGRPGRAVASAHHYLRTIRRGGIPKM